MFRELRRKNRKIDDVTTMEILRDCEYGVLSTIGEDGYPYGVPVSYVYIDNAIYFHSAVEGQKLDNIRNSNRVSFSVVGQTCLLPDKFSTQYRSVIVFGEASEVFDDEKDTALLEIINKYSSGFLEEGKNYIKNSKAKTKVIKIDIKHISGKGRDN